MGEQWRKRAHSDIVLGGLELPQGNIDGNTTLTLGLELVEDPGCWAEIRSPKSDRVQNDDPYHT